MQDSVLTMEDKEEVLFAWVGYVDLYLDNNNEVKVPSYALANIAVKNNFKIKRFSLNLGLQIRNLFDEKYYDNIRTNAFGNRFYEPASLRQFILSINTIL